MIIQSLSDSEIKKIADEVNAMSRKGDEKWLDYIPDGLSQEDNEKLTAELVQRILDDWNQGIKHPCCTHCKPAEATSTVDDEGLFTPSEVSRGT